MPNKKIPVVQTDPYVSIAKDAYEASTSYIDQNYRHQWDDSIRAFRSEHPRGSKYYHESYKFRSKLYRPKTRSTLRRGEAAGAAAFFGNQDLVKIDPLNENDQKQAASAKINHWLCNYRLEKTIPWFLVCIGGLQDAQTTGVVASYNYWDYRKRVSDGKVIADKPVIELRPVENLRIDPSAHWLAPIESSPYVIDLIPMYAADVKEMMRMEDPKTGQPQWKPYTEAEILSAVSHDWDSTRQAREGKRQDPNNNREQLKHFDIVWVHRNIYRQGGDDIVWYTLGTELLLTEPQYLDEVYFHGDRPYTMGQYILETHKIYSSGVPELSRNLQKEANEIANSRMDNVKLAINKRYFVKRGREVDLASLVRNAAGSISLMTDPEGDVKVVDTPDITSSSYAEQDRLNLDYDELVGSFSPSSVQSNRKLNETVGGLQLLRGDAGSMTGYGLKTFVETWMQPTLRQLIKLEQKYETDPVLLSLAGDSAQLYERFGQDHDIDELLDQELTTTVNVGMTATDPGTRLQQLILVTQSFVDIAASNPGMDLKVLADEMYGKIGYRDSSKFWPEGDPPELAKMRQTIAQLQQELANKSETEKIKSQSQYQLKTLEEEGNDRRLAAELEQKDRENERDNNTKELIARLTNQVKAAMEESKRTHETNKMISDRIAEEQRQAVASGAETSDTPEEEALDRAELNAMKETVSNTAKAVTEIASVLKKQEQREAESDKVRKDIAKQIKSLSSKKVS